MCGIVGWVFNRDLNRPGLLERAASTLSSRGPDEQGIWISPDGAAALGHRRLSVIDVSPAGAQPMLSPDGRLAITFNGEIYNHNLLRSKLNSGGFTPTGGWRGTSDTETLLTAFSAWGIEDTLKEANGMFALAVWDARQGSLTLARDRFGEKPLYVARLAQGIAFASELKALRILPGFDNSVNSDALERFLQFGYISAPASIYKSVCKILPGTFVTLNEYQVARLNQAGDFLAPHNQHYWRLFDVATNGLSNPFTGTNQEAVDELQRVLGDAVQRQQISDVPLGAFLSGGIDSTAIVSLMQANSAQKVKTFTIGFDESQFDESVYATKVAQHLGTDHTTVVMSPTEALNRISRLPLIWDEPFADISQLPTLLLSEVTRRSVTVALSGDGGDELFGGYGRYSWMERTWPTLTKFPQVARSVLANGIKLVPISAWNALSVGVARKGQRNLGRRLHDIAWLLPSVSVSELYEGYLNSWKSNEPLMGSGNKNSYAHWSGHPNFPTLVDTLMYRDAVDYLVDDVLVKVDRAAMSVSLETRAPLLDPEVAAFAWRLPQPMKRLPGQGKLPLKELVHRFVPAELVDRPKTGFSVPLNGWLRGPMRVWADDLLNEESLVSSGLNPTPIRNAWASHLAGSANHRYFLWNVLTYQAWNRSPLN